MGRGKVRIKPWKRFGTVAMVLVLMLASWAMAPGEEIESSFFESSLHRTGEGMRYWYEEQGGFMEVTKIPYKDLSCKSCHVKTCDQCHAVEEGGKKAFSREKPRSMETCYPCHGREAKTFRVDTKNETLDVHIDAGMVCVDCHSAEDIHGDGTSYPSMRAPGAVDASCETCHTEESTDAPAFDPMNNRAHKKHRKNLDCAACHVRSTMACYNCHFDSALKEGKKGNFLPMKSWLLLINYEGKVTSGSAMALVYQDKPFIAYVPYYTHSIMSPGRACQDCHGNEAVKLIKAGKKVPVVAWKDGKAAPWEGVVPVAPDSLDWTFLDKVADGQWVPIEDCEAPKTQFAGYGSPLTEKQLKKLYIKMKAK